MGIPPPLTTARSEASRLTGAGRRTRGHSSWKLLPVCACCSWRGRWRWRRFGDGGGIPLTEVAKHSSKTDCWVVVDGQVLNVTKFLSEHPGGELAILTFGGQGCHRTLQPDPPSWRDRQVRPGVRDWHRGLGRDDCRGQRRAQGLGPACGQQLARGPRREPRCLAHQREVLLPCDLVLLAGGVVRSVRDHLLCEELQDLQRPLGSDALCQNRGGVHPPVCAAPCLRGPEANLGQEAGSGADSGHQRPEPGHLRLDALDLHDHSALPVPLRQHPPVRPRLRLAASLPSLPDQLLGHLLPFLDERRQHRASRRERRLRPKPVVRRTSRTTRRDSRPS
ncbi:CYTB5-D [Symbiodinium natans]|uniref:CYTB5-D protein n=1 Tax=Symbiodinium natans TaxID=878477 RepID=A0A812KXC0_9DINO|nr:CYTB5-D [Symbiodinium natans]